MVDVEVSQDSELGHLGLCALVAKGFCGPPYDLSDLSVSLSRFRTGLIRVDFYDMTTSVGPKDKYYQQIDELLSSEEVASRG